MARFVSQGVASGIQNPGCGGSDTRVWGSGVGVEAGRFGLWALRFGVSDLTISVSVPDFWFWGFGDVL